MSIRVSVITATWNCSRTIGDCLRSTASQTWSNREHVIIDGGSTDGTVQTLRAHAHNLAVLVSEPDAGMYDAINKGIWHSTGDVIGFLHGDDMYADEHVLARVVEAFSDPSVCAVYGDLQYVQPGDPRQVVRHWRSSPTNPTLLKWGWMPPHPTLYVRREWYERIGGFDTRYRIAADYFSILQMFSNPDFRAVYLPHVLVKMRTGGASNRSVRNILRKSREDLDALQRSGVGALGGYGALAWKNLSKLPQFVARPEAH